MFIILTPPTMVHKKAPPPHHVAQNKKLIHPQKVFTSIQHPDSRKKKTWPSKSQEPAKNPAKPAAATPNYMKPTTSSVARKEVNTDGPPHDFASSVNHKATKAKAVRVLTKNPVRACASVTKRSRRGTCSSALKRSESPAHLSLNPGGTEAEGASVMKVCPYTYCSLNGHRHPPLLPPLKCFMSARRGSTKAQRSLEVGCVVKDYPEEDGKIWVNDSGEEHKDTDSEKNSEIIERDDNEVEDQEENIMKKIFEADNENTVDQEDVVLMDDQLEDRVPSSLLVEEINEEISSELPGESSMEDVKSVKQDAGDTESDVSEAGKDFESLTTEEPIIEKGCDELGSSVGVSADKFSHYSDESFNGGVSSNIDHDSEFTCSIEQDDKTHNLIMNEDVQEGSHIQNQENPIENFTNWDPINDQEKDCHSEADPENTEKTAETDDDLWILATTMCSRPTENTYESVSFNPRAPNFLPLEPDPKAQRVDLKHKDLDERKNAEQWMVDYALRQAVMRLSFERKRKVAILVEAFEKVSPGKKCELRLGRAARLDQAIAMQACS